MRRRVLGLFAAVSLVLCVGAAWLWVRTYSVGDKYYSIERHPGEAPFHGWVLQIDTYRGEVVTLMTSLDASRMRGASAAGQNEFSREFIGLFSYGGSRPAPGWRTVQPRDLPAQAGQWWGFSFEHSGGGTPVERAAVAVPCWPLVLITALCPAYWLMRRLRTRRRENSCTKCFYDLTGNTSGVCPECGTPLNTPPGRPPKVPIPHGKM